MTGVVDKPEAQTSERVEEYDVVIVGAGISGVSSAWHVHHRCPGKSYAVLEARDNLGGTWDLFRYPGIRCDSDIFTLGFRFRPIGGRKMLTDGGSILRYLDDTVKESGIDQHIQYRSRVAAASWSSAEQKWTLTVQDPSTGQERTVRAAFVHSAGGYYSYDKGYTPDFKGADQFQGQIVHPQFWPEDLDYKGKKVVVIGSGATAVTLVPSLAEAAGRVTMLQRSPSYILPVPETDIPTVLLSWLPERIGYPINRWAHWAIQSAQYEGARRFPKATRALIRQLNKMALPKGYPVDVHFNPRYNPWDERLCVVPNGDLFRAIRQGKAEVVTDKIETFTPTGLKLKSGAALDADIVVTATGFNANILDQIGVSVDGQRVDRPNLMVYKGMMLSDVPNFAFTLGYTNASWTLKADLVAEYVSRLLNYMDEQGYATVAPAREPDVGETPLMDFTPGYVQRVIDQLPKQGDRKPWRLNMNYLFDVLDIRRSKIDNGTLRFARRNAVKTEASQNAAVRS